MTRKRGNKWTNRVSPSGDTVLFVVVPGNVKSVTYAGVPMEPFKQGGKSSSFILTNPPKGKQ